MADKKAILVNAKGVKLTDAGEALDKLNKKAAVLPNAETATLADKAATLGGVKTTGAEVAAVLEKSPFAVLEGAADAVAAALGGVKTTGAEVAAVLEKAPFAVLEGAADAVAAALEAANRRTVVVVAADDGVAFYGMGINGKAGKVARKVDSGDIALTIATIADLPIGEDCESAIIYQVLKDPNLKLNELIKLQEALARMESVIERNNREPWDKHDCA